MNILRYWHTLRYVPLGRLVWRVYRRVRQVYQQTPIYTFLLEQYAAPLGPVVQPPMLWKGDKAHAKKIIEENAFTFTGVEKKLAGKRNTINWLPNGVTPLWTFHLHYWDWVTDLHALGTPEAQQKALMLTEDWLLACDGYDATIWHPYPTSLRVVNMLTYADWLLRDASPQLQEAYMHSLRRQLVHLRANTEWDLGENHLIKNIKALIYAGVCLPEYCPWLVKSLAWLEAECALQIGPEGMHCERSPSYHVQVLQDLLDVQALLKKAKIKTPLWLDASIEHMGTVLAALRHLDGRLALMHDGFEGDVKHLQAIQKRAGGQTLKGTFYSSDGFVAVRNEHAYLLADMGGVSPNRNPGHAHAQALCFEYSFAGQRVFVNRGTFGYQHNKRLELKSSAAHNCLTIEDANSADVWGRFRVGKRPHVVAEVAKLKHQTATFSGTTDAYKKFGVTHTRQFKVQPSGALKGMDTLLAKAGRKVRVYFHVYPEVQLKLHDEQTATLTLPDKTALQFKVEGGRLFSQPTTYHAQFGQTEKTTSLVIQARTRKGEKQLKWQITPL